MIFRFVSDLIQKFMDETQKTPHSSYRREVVPSRSPETKPSRAHVQTERDEDNLWEITLNCPQCGAPQKFDVTLSFYICGFCGVALFISQVESRPYMFKAKNLLRTERDILDVFITYEAMQRRAELLGRIRAGGPFAQLGSGPPIFRTPGGREGGLDLVDLVDPSLDKFKREVEGKCRIRDTWTFWVPYWGINASLIHFAFGRDPSLLTKKYVPIGFRIEAIVRAYSDELNLRDEGMKYSLSALEPLTSEDLQTGVFIKPQTSPNQLDTLLKRLGQDRRLLKKELNVFWNQPVWFQIKRFIFYRPIIITYFDGPGSSRWAMVDGQFRTIAGYPKIEELETFRLAGKTTVEPVSIPEYKPRIVPGKCPNCGFDITLRKSESYVMCGNCGRLYRPTDEGYAHMEYEVVLPEVFQTHDSDLEKTWKWLPWFLFSVHHKDAFSEAIQTNFPALVSLLEKNTSLYVPAFHAFLYREFDQWTLRVMRALVDHEPGTHPMRFFTHISVEPESILLPKLGMERMLTQLADFVPIWLSKRERARLRPPVLREILQHVKLARQPRIVYIPFKIVQRAGLGPCLVSPEERPTFIPWERVLREKWPPAWIRSKRFPLLKLYENSLGE